MANTILTQLTDTQYFALAEILGYASANLESDADNASCDESEAEAKDLLDRVEDLVQALNHTKSYLWTSGSGKIELDIAAKHVSAIARPGNNKPAIVEALEDPYLAAQFDKVKITALYEELEDSGMDTENIKTMGDAMQHLLWIACHDINDGRSD